MTFQAVNDWLKAGALFSSQLSHWLIMVVVGYRLTLAANGYRCSNTIIIIPVMSPVLNHSVIALRKTYYEIIACNDKSVREIIQASLKSLTSTVKQYGKYRSLERTVHCQDIRACASLPAAPIHLGEDKARLILQKMLRIRQNKNYEVEDTWNKTVLTNSSCRRCSGHPRLMK